MEAPTTFETGDVVRAQRAGNRTRGNYTIIRMADHQPAMDSFIAVYARREFSDDPTGTFMLLNRRGLRVLRSYR